MKQSIVVQFTAPAFRIQLNIFDSSQVDELYDAIIRLYKLETGTELQKNRLVIVSKSETWFYKEEWAYNSVLQRFGITKDKNHQFFMAQLVFPRYESEKSREKILKPSEKTLEKGAKHKAMLALPVDGKGFRYRISVNPSTTYQEIINMLARKLNQEDPRHLLLVLAARWEEPLFHMKSVPATFYSEDTLDTATAFRGGNVIERLADTYFIILKVV